MTYRFYITAGSSRVEVHPLGWRLTKLVDTRQRGQMFFRRTLEGELTFTDTNGSPDFSLMWLTERVDNCRMVLFEAEQRDGGVFYPYWQGWFTTTDGTFDLDKCTFTVTPKTFDVYTPFDKDGDKEYNIFTMGLSKMTIKIPGQDYKHNYRITNVISWLVSQIAPGLTFSSMFLTNSSNPVIGGDNQYRHLTIAQKSDIKRPDATNPASIGMISFNSLMHILKMYNLYWVIEGTTFRIEHYNYWESEAGLDLRGRALSRMTNRYSYRKDDMPRYERFAFMEAGDGNYVEHTIEYDANCVNNDISAEYRVDVTTDLSFIRKCMSTPGEEGAISDSGWVVLASQYDGADYNVYYGTSYASAAATYNYVNSWSYLLRAFFMHGRVLMRGLIQGFAYDFISALKTKLQEVSATVCRADGYDPNDYITTELGERYLHQKGYVSRAALKPDGGIDFELLYGEDKNTEVEMPPRSKNLHIVIDTSSYSEIISILSEPNIYDTKYWILWNDGAAGEACQEIVIPAGTTYQVDDSDLEDPFASIKFNLSDASLTGWTKIYNDNAPIVAAGAGTCPGGAPPEPPPVPDEPVAVGAAQIVDCGAVHVGWGSVGDATYYVIYRNPDFSLNNNWILLDSTVNTYYDDSNNVTATGETFTYRIRACNINGCSGDSNEVSTVIMCM